MGHFMLFLVLAISFHTYVLGDELIYPCAIEEDCDAIQDSYCSIPDNACLCPLGHVFNSELTKCLPVSGGYGAICEENVQCTMRMLTGAYCYYDEFLMEGTCRCSDGYHYLHSRCHKSVGLNGSCTSSDQCYGNWNYESLSCSPDGACVCSEGFYLHADQTYCRREGTEVGDDCFFDFDCKFDGGICSTEKKCTMMNTRGNNVHHLFNPAGNDRSKYDHEVSDSQSSDQRDAFIPLECTTNADCTAVYPNSECSQGNKCWCSAGYYYLNSKCNKELGEPCTADSECNHITRGLCRIPKGALEGVCLCDVTSTPGANNQRCNLLKLNVGFNCQGQLETCQNFGPECECVSLDGGLGTCECSSNSYFEEANQACWYMKGFGETCVNPLDCVTPSGTEGVDCIDGTCQCIANYHETNKDCRKDAIEYGDACIDNVDCVFPNAMCVDKKCTCDNGYYTDNSTSGVIECITGIGGMCTDDTYCDHIENAFCNVTTEMCVCDSIDDGMLISNEIHSNCIKVADHYAEECIEDSQCQITFGQDILCTDEMCVCKEDYHFRDNSCWPMTMLGEKCTVESQCYVASDSNRSECRNGFCECKYDFYSNPENTDCTSGGIGVHQKVGLFTSIFLMTFTMIASGL